MTYPPLSLPPVAQLYAELSELNLNLPARVCVPLYGSCHQVLRVPTSEAVVLNSKSKVGRGGWVGGADRVLRCG